jgi:hypothetical protein
MDLEATKDGAALNGACADVARFRATLAAEPERELVEPDLEVVTPLAAVEPLRFATEDEFERGSRVFVVADPEDGTAAVDVDLEVDVREVRAVDDLDNAPEDE